MRPGWAAIVCERTQINLCGRHPKLITRSRGNDRDQVTQIIRELTDDVVALTGDIAFRISTHRTAIAGDDGVAHVATGSAAAQPMSAVMNSVVVGDGTAR